MGITYVYKCEIDYLNEKLKIEEINNFNSFSHLFFTFFTLREITVDFSYFIQLRMLIMIRSRDSEWLMKSGEIQL